MNDTLHYMIRFLLGDDIPEEIVGTIGYTSNRSQYYRYSLVIVPSGFFDDQVYGSQLSMPTLPLPEVEGVPLLFGSDKTEWMGNTWVIYSDIIASTYFLITRYEEIMKRNIRDEHGRFPGKESLPYRAGFLNRPIVDEYRRLLRRWLRQCHIQVPDTDNQVRKVYLTHDVDAPFQYRSWKGLVRSFIDRRGIHKSISGKFGLAIKDPYYTFPWLFRQNSILEDIVGKEHCRTILFFKSGGNTQQDKPVYNLRSADMQKLIKETLAHEAEIGLHASYQSGIHPSHISKEKKRLEDRIGKTLYANRHHYLSSREPEDMDRLEAAGITDDFTMGYADVAGFRLGTSYPVRWINPTTRRLSPLLLHPLTVMDCSLDSKKYMGLDYEEAESYCTHLIKQVNEVGGEIVLLWHNTSFREHTDSYHRKLYSKLLNELTKK